jgi:hypothetical protein
VELFRLRLCFALGLNRRKFVASRPVRLPSVRYSGGMRKSGSSQGELNHLLQEETFHIVLYLDAFPHS